MVYPHLLKFPPLLHIMFENQIGPDIKVSPNVPFRSESTTFYHFNAIIVISEFLNCRLHILSFEERVESGLICLLGFALEKMDFGQLSIVAMTVSRKQFIQCRRGKIVHMKTIDSESVLILIQLMDWDFQLVLVRP